MLQWLRSSAMAGDTALSVMVHCTVPRSPSLHVMLAKSALLAPLGTLLWPPPVCRSWQRPSSGWAASSRPRSS